MKNKNIHGVSQFRLRAIVGTDNLPPPVPRIGLFASQEKYCGQRLFAVYINGVIDRVFSSYSEAKKYVRCFKSWFNNCDFDIVLFEVCASKQKQKQKGVKQ